VGNLGEHTRTIFKLNLKEIECGLDSAGCGYDQAEDSCEHSNEI
jgi:hypothetical protein